MLKKNKKNNPICRSCGVKVTEHLGIQGTCEILQSTNILLKELLSASEEEYNLVSSLIKEDEKNHEVYTRLGRVISKVKEYLVIKNARN